jgi:pimeloyl-ACP methyl ester carboxylesterase
MSWSHHEATVNGVRLHYAAAGAGPLVLLLHGFPEFWYTWQHQLPALAAAGFRAVAPDLRGYNLSDKPRGVRPFRIETLARDVAELIAHLGADRAAVVGHDWGGAIAWEVAMNHPARVGRLAILNAPHPARFFRELRNPRQLLRSWYVFFFQLPGLPEWWVRRGNYAALEHILRTDPVRPGTFSDEDVRAYREALDQPGALTAAINYYRAAFRWGWGAARRAKPVACPTLVLWGLQDRYLGPRLTEGLEPWAPNLEVVRLADASHWVQNDAAEEVNRRLVAFLGT